jgi:hypothetical protein
MPANRKPSERRQRPAPRELALATTSVVAVPAGMSSWRAEIMAAWSDLWTSPLGSHFKPTDVPSLRRLFILRSRLVDALERADAEPEMTGSTGQTVLSPWFAEAHRLEAEIERLEDRFGLTPLSRVRLGVQLEQGVSLAAQNAALMEAYRNG